MIVIKKIIIIVFLSFLLSGCLDFKELKNVSFCFGIGIDYSKEEEYKYLMTIETEVIDSHSPDINFETRIHESKGNTFIDAYSNLTATTSSLIDFTHCQLIIISNEISISDLTTLINALFDNTMLPNSVAILISTEKTAKEVLESDSITNATVSFEIIYALKENGNYYDSTFKKTLNEAYNDLNGEFGNFYLPTIKNVTIKESKTSSIEGAYLYNNFERKLYMEHDEFRDSLILNRRLQKLLYNMNIEDEDITIFVDSFKRKVNTTFDENFNMHFTIDLEISSTDAKACDKDIAKKFQEELKKEIEDFFYFYKEQNIDVFNLKTYLYKHNYRLFKKHESKAIIENINLELSLKVTIKERGFVR